MATEAIERDFRRGVSEQVRLAPEGPRRYRVFTPFRFDDGDHLVIALRREDAGWDERYGEALSAFVRALRDIAGAVRPAVRGHDRQGAPAKAERPA